MEWQHENNAFIKFCMTLLIVLTLSFATGCTNNNNFEYVDIRTGYETQTYVVEDQPNPYASLYSDPYSIQTYEYVEDMYTEEEEQALWDEQQQRREAADEYAARTAAWKKQVSEIKAEEQRIEAYCNEFGYLQCNSMTYTCLTEHECNKVQLECEDAGFDKERLIRTQDVKYDCNDWEATVFNEDFFYKDIDLVDFSDAGVQE